jgi:hypothetical protein
MDAPLRELMRVLRPGGILLTSRGTERSGRKAKIKSRAVFTTLLQTHGAEDVQIDDWWKLFDRVLAVKQGDSAPAAAKSLARALQCSSCRSVSWHVLPDRMTCLSCRNELSVTSEGIVLNLDPLKL